MHADHVFRGGPIVTCDKARPAVEAVAVLRNTIVAAGPSDEVNGLVGPQTTVHELDGRCLIPGLNDNHTHPMMFGQSLAQIDATPAALPRLVDVQDAFRRAADEQNGHGGWLIGRGYDDTRLDVKRHPTASDLDAVTGDRPAWLVRTCGHLGVANTAALRLAGITATTADPQGGEIDRDEHGEATGLLRENAMQLVSAVLPKPDVADHKRFLLEAGKKFLAWGVTSIVEARLDSSVMMSAYQELHRDCALPNRVSLMMLIDPTLDDLVSLGLKTGFGDEWLRIGPAKVFQDGSGGGRTAAMSVPYPGQPDNYGITIYSQEELNERFVKANRSGFQMTAHAIGDRAISMILTAYETALADTPRQDHRARIEHCGLCTSEILERMVALGVMAAPQASFIYYLGDSYRRNFTEAQLAMSYPLKSWQEAGIPFSLSTDVPVVSADPMVNLRSAVTRLTQDGELMGGNQAIGIEEALRAYTIAGAWGTFEEEIKGSITPGKLADLVILDRDPRAVPGEELPIVKVELTMLDGEIVYSR